MDFDSPWLENNVGSDVTFDMQLSFTIGRFVKRYCHRRCASSGVGAGVEPRQDASASARRNGLGFNHGGGAPTRGANASHMNRLAVGILEFESKLGLRSPSNSAEVMARFSEQLRKRIGKRRRGKRRAADAGESSDFHG
jgi:hypothetical protein